MGAKLQKINNKNTKFTRVGGGIAFISRSFIIRQTYLNATKAEYLKHCFRVKVPVLSCKEISPC